MTDQAVRYLLRKVIARREHVRRETCDFIRASDADLQTKANQVRLTNSRFDKWLATLRKDLESRGAVYADAEWYFIVNKAVGSY